MNFYPWNIRDDDFANRVKEDGTVCWDGREWQILLPVHERNRKSLFVQQIDCTNSPVWRVGKPSTLLPSNTIWLSKEEHPSPQELVLESLQAGRLVLTYFTDSLFNLRAQGDLATRMFSLNPQGRGAFKRIADVSFESPPWATYFSWPCPLEGFSPNDPLAWWKVLNQEWSNPDSDASFALYLGQLPSKQQQDTIWKWKNGDYETAEELLRLALLSADELWERESWWRWDIFLPLRDAKGYGAGTVRPWGAGSEPNVPASLQRASELINHYLAPHADERLMRTSVCVQEWQRTHVLSFGVRVESPTMHERMEATLLWREWQKKMGG